MKVLFHTKEIEVQDVKNVEQLLKKLELIPNTVIVLKDGQIVENSKHVPLSDNNRVEIIKVISGG